MKVISEQGLLFKEPHFVGRRLLKLPAGITSRAIFGGPNDCYRYRLERIWNENLNSVMFLMMNPSTATAEWDDSTLAKVRKLAIRWGYGRLLVGNTFAYRCTEQIRLMETEDPEGPENMRHLMEMALEADKVILGFGRPKIKPLQEQGPRIAKILMDRGIPLYSLKNSDDGTPWHPLYVSDDTEPKLWSGVIRSEKANAPGAYA